MSLATATRGLHGGPICLGEGRGRRALHTLLSLTTQKQGRRQQSAAPPVVLLAHGLETVQGTRNTPSTPAMARDC